MVLGSAVGVSVAILAWRAAPTRTTHLVFSDELSDQDTDERELTLTRPRRTRRAGDPSSHGPGAVFATATAPAVERVPEHAPPILSPGCSQRELDQAPKRGPPLS